MPPAGGSLQENSAPPTGPPWDRCGEVANSCGAGTDGMVVYPMLATALVELNLCGSPGCATISWSTVCHHHSFVLIVPIATARL